jgi:hypothetical protein
MIAFKTTHHGLATKNSFASLIHKNSLKFSKLNCVVTFETNVTKNITNNSSIGGFWEQLVDTSNTFWFFAMVYETFALLKYSRYST